MEEEGGHVEEVGRACMTVRTRSTSSECARVPDQVGGRSWRRGEDERISNINAPSTCSPIAECSLFVGLAVPRSSELV